MLTFEYCPGREAIEIHGDREGLKLLIKRLNSLLNLEPGSYSAHAVEGNKHHRNNILANNYTIFLAHQKPQTPLRVDKSEVADGVRAQE